jgi:methionine sulfoxide reductase heme-binding subunit
MTLFSRLLNSLLLFWLLLAVPALFQLWGWTSGATDTMDMLHPTGETSARLMLAAMLLGPLAGLLGRRGWLLWLLARRRALGVAAFAYAVLHLIFYLLDMGSIAAVWIELPIASIWTGWFALLLLLLMALTSNQAAMRRLRAGWKSVQRLAYPAALLTLLHWWWVHDGAQAAFVHFAPLMGLWALLAARKLANKSPLPQTGV